MLNTQIPMITTIKPIKSLSTARSSILLFTLRPAKPPKIPQHAMTTSISMSTPAVPPVASDATVLAACENKMM